MLSGVDYIIHAASPLAGKASPQETLQVRFCSFFNSVSLNSLEDRKERDFERARFCSKGRGIKGCHDKQLGDYSRS